MWPNDWNNTSQGLLIKLLHGRPWRLAEDSLLTLLRLAVYFCLTISINQRGPFVRNFFQHGESTVVGRENHSCDDLGHERLMEKPTPLAGKGERGRNKPLLSKRITLVSVNYSCYCESFPPLINSCYY